MKYIYILKIDCDSNQIDNVSAILKTNASHSKYGIWELEIIETETDIPVKLIESFLGILDGKYEELAKIGIQRSDISIWMLYEYDGQCNMEFSPDNMKRLGDNGIILCVSCWESST